MVHPKAPSNLPIMVGRILYPHRWYPGFESGLQVAVMLRLTWARLTVEGCACGKMLVPAPRSWPTESRRNLKAHACEPVMQSLASGYWPIWAMLIESNSTHSVEWREGMLTQLDVSGMEMFDLYSMFTDWVLLRICNDISHLPCGCFW